jgi:hypothetical protein
MVQSATEVPLPGEVTTRRFISEGISSAMFSFWRAERGESRGK